MGGVTDIGLTAQEFYYYGAGLENLQADRRGFWTPNYSGAGICSDSTSGGHKVNFRVSFEVRLLREMLNDCWYFHYIGGDPPGNNQV